MIACVLIFNQITNDFSPLYDFIVCMFFQSHRSDNIFYCVVDGVHSKEYMVTEFLIMSIYAATNLLMLIFYSGEAVLLVVSNCMGWGGGWCVCMHVLVCMHVCKYMCVRDVSVRCDFL